MSGQKHNRKNIRTSLLIFVVITLFYCTGYAQQGTLTWLGALDDSTSVSSGVSDDGQFIVGYGLNGITGQDEGYILDISVITSVDESQIIPGSVVLNQNFPNPFNLSTIISYQLPISGQVSLKVYDLFGREIKTLVNEEKPSGFYEVNFDASKNTPGIYIYKLQAGSFGVTKKMILMK